MKLDKYNIKSARNIIQAELDAIGEKHGITLKMGSITYDGDSFTTKLSAAVVGALTPEQKCYDASRAWDKKMPKRGSAIMIHAKVYEVIGLKSRGKYIYVVKDLDGKITRFNSAAWRSRTEI